MKVVVGLILLPPTFLIAIISRFSSRPIDVGLGPETLSNNIYHKKALMRAGYSAETFVFDTNFISSDYDIITARWWPIKGLRIFYPYLMFIKALFRYKCLFIYFNGGPLFPMIILAPFEPLFYKLANLKVVVMPYGSDVQVMTRSRNLYFKHAMFMDYPEMYRSYPQIRWNVDRWTRRADWVISGVEWVDYMYHWDTLMLGHFSIDMDLWRGPDPADQNLDVLKILHAPNHTALKGTQALMRVIDKLKAEGLAIELIVLRGVSSETIRKKMAEVDLVADQFVGGWYAMFSMEAMCMQKPVLCYLRRDLVELYQKAGLLDLEELPIINTGILDIEEKIRWAYNNRKELRAVGLRGRAFIQKHHSLDKIGSTFRDIVTELGIRAKSQ